MKILKHAQGLVAGVLLLLPFSIQAQNATWAKLIHGQYTDTPSSLCTDADDNVYICGRMSYGEVDGNPIGIVGTYDSFLAKFDSEGTYQWAVSAGGGFGSSPMNLNEGDGARRVVYDSITNAIYMTGIYQSSGMSDSARFGPGISVAGRGSYLAKYDLNGTCLWMRSTSNGFAGSVAIDEIGQAYFYVFSDDSYLLQSTVFNASPSVTLPNGQLVAKYTSDGQLLWAKSIGHNIDGNIRVRSGHLYFAGGNFGSGSTILDEPIQEDATLGIAFLASLDSSCSSLEWIRQFPASYSSFLPEIELTSDSGFVLSGGFKGSLYLPGDTLLSESSGTDQMCLRLDRLGNIVWYFSLDATGYSGAHMSQAPDGSFYLAFTFEDSFTFNGQTITAAHDIDYAVIRVSPNGTLLGIETNGPVSQGRIDLITLSDGSPVLTSRFTFTIDFGNGHELTGGADIFVAKLGIITGVQSLALPGGEGELLIYANPNQGTCSIELPQDLLNEQDLVLRIMDVQGRVVQESPLNIGEGTVHLDIRSQATGTYVAEVGNATKRYTGRIVFE